MQRVWYFNGGEQAIAPKLAHLLSDLDAVQEMPDLALCTIMREEGSNKSDRRHHRYTPFYDALFHDLDAKLVFEIGIGSTNPAMLYHMQAHNIPGGSLRGWKRYFPNARVYGADYDRAVLFRETRIKTYFVNQFEAESIRSMWFNLMIEENVTHGSFDMILDDAVHRPVTNQNFFRNSIDMLKPNGWFIIEDLDRHSQPMMDEHRAFLASIPYPSIIVDIPNPGYPINNCFAAIHKV